VPVELCPLYLSKTSRFCGEKLLFFVASRQLLFGSYAHDLLVGRRDCAVIDTNVA